MRRDYEYGIWFGAPRYNYTNVPSDSPAPTAFGRRVVPIPIPGQQSSPAGVIPPYPAEPMRYYEAPVPGAPGGR